ncbi:hypothetical protein RhiirA1_415533 [Rhizophagus irregularis]|uniref:Uncharacterized protein n=4 Tax=Rhizophagus irregularis TaxID=588596 RepID=A0A2N0S1T8_9GLOM|nr:hypothetical protein GLOIN_2v1648644 [Rhizophagus irregularis DAOM 181602=DAOM 197198]PKC69514.1 hypothetical protein RhiirA1_415533 [Rhizophagus irregularis]POG67301.1 hypothetical protein GLOIN_2v1648644 [Rhizophagus irregularis DAOM 181602=DAOM 197198]UZO11398.1 hypothetical protein OCT59_002967 [Rhizophagus irregularis]CAB4390494.1 unnamed protein product [Rhizophagus irregularis]CAB4481411.1 unnamed protein product [Rhizophagus irregularis]|eukprot:XP_025174167.1 hypothetical protein GLOIN_2v1648644 [Rhizophagus irregularis DAOM 181602=DAOM 197198]
MSSINYEQRTPYMQKIGLNTNSRRIKRKPQKLCPGCKETDDSVKIFSNKVNRIEEIVNNFHKNFTRKTNRISIFRAKFTLNNIPCELEYDLSNFTLESLQKLANFATQSCNNDNKGINNKPSKKND